MGTVTTRAPVSCPRPVLPSSAPAAGLLAALLVVPLVALLVALTVALGAPAVASETPTQPGDTTAGPSAEPTVADRVKNARAVFVGTLASISRSGTATTPSPGTDGGTGGSTGDGSGGADLQPSGLIFDAEQVYKPRGPRVITTDQVQVALAAPSTGCTADLQLGDRYLVFAASNEGLAARPCDVVLADDATLARVEELTGGSRPAVPVEPAPANAGLEVVEEAAPASFTRTAAPGVAFVLVGVLGLLGLSVVRRVRR